MVSSVPPQKNTTFTIPISVLSLSAGGFQVNPTIASGDFKVSIDGGSYTNLASLPVVTPVGSSDIAVVLSATEMDGDTIRVQGRDAAGDEWSDVNITIQTASSTIDDLADSGDTVVADIAALSVEVGEIHQIHGLDAANPMNVTPTQRTTGSISQAITGDGATTSTVTRT